MITEENKPEETPESKPVINKDTLNKDAQKALPAKKKSSPKKKKPAVKESITPKTQEIPSEKPIERTEPLPSKQPTPIKRSEEIPSKTPIENNPPTPNKSAPVENISEADQIWQSIQHRQLDMFALPNQFVSAYCIPLPVDQKKLFLKYKVQGVLPALEIAAPEFKVELDGGYIVVTNKPWYLP